MKRKNPLPRFSLVLIGLIIGFGIGILGTVFIQNYNPPDESDEPSPSVVFDRIVAQNELVCASQKYNITDKATDGNKLFDLIDIPFTKNSFWYRYVGTIKVGVNLEKASYSTNGYTITIELEQPYIISNTPDMDESGCLEEKNNIFNPIHVEDVDAFRKQCMEQSEAEVIKGGVMDEAKQNAEQNIRNMFYAALGDAYTIEFQWEDAE